MIAVQALLNAMMHDTISYATLSLVNVALVLNGAEAESLIRTVLLGLRRFLSILLCYQITFHSQA